MIGKILKIGYKNIFIMIKLKLKENEIGSSVVKPNTLILGNCLEVMKHIPDQSVDMILTDLPYG